MRRMILGAAFVIPAVYLGVVMAAGATKTATTEQQVYKIGELIKLDKENVAKGQGTLKGQFSFTRDQASAESAIKEIGWMTLEKGSSIGLHQHKDNEDAYIIITGEGVFTDGEGNETIVGPGTITIARPGQSHALRNDKDAPLVFLDIISKNDTYAQQHPQQ
ncbi:MAG: cupin domain-containing protein [Succinivibrio sp.]|nr:cupin domain-containing protein [Succinivibrio sp.]